MSDDLGKGTCDFDLRPHAPQDNCRGWEPTKAKEVVGDLAARNKTLVNSIASYKKRNAALRREIESLRGAPVEPVPAPRIRERIARFFEVEEVVVDSGINGQAMSYVVESSAVQTLLDELFDLSAPVPAQSFGSKNGGESWEGNGPCMDCHRASPFWHAPNDVWQAVMDREGNFDHADPPGVICPTCFVIRAWRKDLFIEPRVWWTWEPIPEGFLPTGDFAWAIEQRNIAQAEIERLGSAPVPAPRLEWEEENFGWSASHFQIEYCMAGERKFVSLAMDYPFPDEDVLAAKLLAEKLNDALSPPVGPK